MLKRGTVLKAPSLNLVFRFIEFQKMSTYVIDDVKQDLSKFSALKSNYVIKPLAVTHSEKQLVLINKW